MVPTADDIGILWIRWLTGWPSMEQQLYTSTNYGSII